MKRHLQVTNFVRKFNYWQRSQNSSPKFLKSSLQPSMGLACDIRMASAQAFFGFPEVKRALFVTNGVMYFLPKLVGLGRAKDWLLTGEKISAQEALETGLITDVLPADQLMKSVLDKSRIIAANAPRSIRLTKEAFQQTNEMDLESVLKLEENSVVACHAGEDFVEGARAFIT
jgi:enoyl-CoA hydratase/carnithine racemase